MMMFVKNAVVRLFAFVYLSVCIALPQVASAAKGDDTERFRSLANSICGFYLVSGSRIAQRSKGVIQRFIAKYEGIQHPTGKQMLLFLNKYKHKLTCKTDGVEKNYMMVAFDRRAERTLFDELMFTMLTPEDQSVLPDVNAVSYTGANGAPETVLDYMERLIKTNALGRKNTKQIKDLKETFVEELGAKRFDQLSAKEQAMFNKAK